jgi:hypothetical protein
MGAVYKDPMNVEYFEVARNKFVAGDDYADAIKQHEQYGFGWSIDKLNDLGCGPLRFVRYENRPRKGH